MSFQAFQERLDIDARLDALQRALARTGWCAACALFPFDMTNMVGGPPPCSGDTPNARGLAVFQCNYDTRLLDTWNLPPPPRTFLLERSADAPTQPYAASIANAHATVEHEMQPVLRRLRLHRFIERLDRVVLADDDVRASLGWMMCDRPIRVNSVLFVVRPGPKSHCRDERIGVLRIGVPKRPWSLLPSPPVPHMTVLVEIVFADLTTPPSTPDGGGGTKSCSSLSATFSSSAVMEIPRAAGSRLRSAMSATASDLLSPVSSTGAHVAHRVASATTQALSLTSPSAVTTAARSVGAATSRVVVQPVVRAAQSVAVPMVSGVVSLPGALHDCARTAHRRVRCATTGGSDDSDDNDDGYGKCFRTPSAQSAAAWQRHHAQGVRPHVSSTNPFADDPASRPWAEAADEDHAGRKPTSGGEGSTSAAPPFHAVVGSVDMGGSTTTTTPDPASSSWFAWLGGLGGALTRPFRR